MKRAWANPFMRVGAFLSLGYVGFVLMLLAIENFLVFRPIDAREHWVEPPTARKIDDIELTSSDGTRLHAWWCGNDESDLAVLYCHGNAGNLSHRGGSIVKLGIRLNVSVLIIDYPGYGKSEGQPTETGCYLAADAGYDWLIKEKKYPPTKVMLYGASLGGGVMTQVASRRDHRALILVKTFTSAPDVASEHFWWLPVPKRILMTNQFDSLSRIDKCKRPVFIAHGTADRLIPHSQGERLFAAANEPKHFCSLPGCDHNDALPDSFFDSLREFLRANPVE
jgi:fermentation-respiration switch protein FrsA (DUF1100 family)